MTIAVAGALGDIIPAALHPRTAQPSMAIAEISSEQSIVADDTPVATGLWIGDTLPLLAQLCIRSFQDCGFTFRLFTYQPVSGIPSGTQVADASTILPAADIFQHVTGSLAHFSDWFRYRFLERDGGIWTDMDVVCLKPFRWTSQPWFALQEPRVAAIGVIAFPPRHPLLSLLDQFACDPASPMPWDTSLDLQEKLNLRKERPGVRDRRAHVPWGTTGPGIFTKAIRHFGLWESAAPPSSIYPIHFSRWRSYFDGSAQLSDAIFCNAWAIHLWGELLRREPDALEDLAGNSIVADLLKRYNVSVPRPESQSTRFRKRFDILKLARVRKALGLR